MIDVKGTKSQAAATDPAERYVLKNNDRKSKTPALFSVFLMGVALYLKSVFPNWLHTDEDDTANDAGPQSDVVSEIAEAASPETIVPDGLATGTVEEPGEPSSEGDTVAGPGAPAGLIFGDASEPAQIRAAISLDWSDFNARSDWYAVNAPVNGKRAANDNFANGSPYEGVVPAGIGGDPGSDDHDDAVTDDARLDDDQADTGAGDSPEGDGDNPGSGQAECECADDGLCDEDEDRQSVNRAPRVSGPVYLLDVAGCAILAIGLLDLLQNATDPDGDPLTVENLTVSSGTLTQTADGWFYHGGSNSLGPVVITYEISDGAVSIDQTAHFSVIPRFIGGSDGDDVLVGSPCADDIDGGDGNDNIDSGAGNDTVSGGTGEDHIVANAGNDTIFGGDGDDIVFGGTGKDHISGGDGDDRLFGEAGDDIIFGDAGNDYLSGGDGDDYLAGGEGNDVVMGDAGDDVMNGGDGNDELHGGAGNDTLVDGRGEDYVFGGKGNDLVVASADGEDDVLDGGDGCDTLDYSTTSQGIVVDLVSETACGVEIGEDTITGFETVRGGAGDDHFIAGEKPMVFIGGGGDNMFEFQPLPVTPAAAMPPTVVMHDILDFKVGDRVRMSKYDIFESVLEGLDERFEDVYGDDVEDDEIAIRYRDDHTVIEADFDNDDFYETSITLYGNHVLVIIEHA